MPVTVEAPPLVQRNWPGTTTKVWRRSPPVSRLLTVASSEGQKDGKQVCGSAGSVSHSVVGREMTGSKPVSSVYSLVFTRTPRTSLSTSPVIPSITTRGWMALPAVDCASPSAV